MRLSSHAIRSAAVVALAVTVFGTTGCHWFRKKNDLYAASPESRPLEVPPDLNLPDTSGAMKMPAGANGASPAGAAVQGATGSVSRSSLPAPAAAATAANPTGFTVAGDRDAVFAKVGESLAATAGVTIASKAQILGTYDIDYAGSKFLVRVVKVEAGSYVSAVDPRGLPASGEAPAKLIASLKAALGG